ncbi:MAG: tryptophan-rich sensory protein [Clostridia bacterium]|jgi:tryptophan-rich sensory protein|nr:tryptophan-rich sensory protein [Clostridia bacterium]
MKMKKLSPAAAYAAGIGIALAVGLISALASMEGMKRFAQLSQPPLAPPGWLFPVVWTALYTLMGISAARVYLKNTMDTRPALLIWSAQLIVNALWSPLFFSLGLRLAAFVWLLILIVLVVRMIADFKKIDIPAGNLQFPYLIWLLFAAYLNMGTYLLNR